MLLDRLSQTLERRGRALLVDQKHRIDLARRVVHRDNQIQRRPTRQPSMRRAILKQHHARQGLTNPLLAMHAARLGSARQAPLLQNALRPGVAALEARTVQPSHPGYRLVKMLRIEIEIACRERLNPPFDLVHSSATPRSSTSPPVDQTFRPFCFVSIPKPAKMTLAHSQRQSRINAAQPSMPIPPNRINDPSHPYLP